MWEVSLFLSFFFSLHAPLPGLGFSRRWATPRAVVGGRLSSCLSWAGAALPWPLVVSVPLVCVPPVEHFSLGVHFSLQKPDSWLLLLPSRSSAWQALRAASTYHLTFWFYSRTVDRCISFLSVVTAFRILFYMLSIITMCWSKGGFEESTSNANESGEHE